MSRNNVLTISLFCLANILSAQVQLPNSNFEQWTTTASGNAIPKYWHSFGDADCQLKGIYSWGCPFMLKNHSNRVTGHTGYGCEIYADFVGGVALVNGVLTTGQMRFATPNNNSSENHNYTDRNNTGGHHAAIPFTGKPDSVIFWCKFNMKKKSNVAMAKFHIHGNVSYKDISTHQSTTAQKGKIGNAFCEIKDPNDHKWHQYRYKFDYYNEQNQKVSYISNRPSYILVSFSTNKITKGGNAGDKLAIDDIKMIYNKRLASIEINGDVLPEFDPDKHDYVIYGDNHILPNITVSCQSPHAQASIEQPTHENGHQAIIKVMHDDGELVYTIRFVEEVMLAEER